MSRVLLLYVAACGSATSPIDHYHCTPGSGAQSVLSGTWRPLNSMNVYSEFSMVLQGTPGQLCGFGTLGPATRQSRAGLSGTEKRIRWDTVCTLAGPNGWQPDCSLNQIVDTIWWDAVQIDGDTIQLNNAFTLYRQK